MTVTRDPLLNGGGQADALGITREHLSRLKRAHSPGGPYADYPFPDPETTIGGQDLLRRSTLLAWDADRPGKGNVGRTGRPRTSPPDLTRAQWAALLALHTEKATPGARVGARLTSLGLIAGRKTAPWYRVTPAGRHLIDHYQGSQA